MGSKKVEIDWNEEIKFDIDWKKAEQNFKKGLINLVNAIAVDPELQVNSMMAYKMWIDLLHESYEKAANVPIINGIAHNMTQTYLLFRIFGWLTRLDSIETFKDAFKD